MKKLLGVLTMAVASTACQHQTPPAESARLQAAPPVAMVAETAPPKALHAAPGDTLTAPMQALLRDYDVAELWSGRDPIMGGSLDSSRVELNGFFGPDHYRISFVFLQVSRDSTNPALFHVSGKNRYKKQISTFTGFIKVQNLADLDRHYLDLAPEDSLAQGYTARALFSLQEDPTQPNAGKFEGTEVLDFYISPKGKVGYAQTMGGEDSPTRGQGLLFKGNWLSNTTGTQKELLMARSVFSIAPDVLKNFSIGDRDATINPKYAKLGWNNYWENDEWWADSPKPSLNL